MTSAQNTNEIVNEELQAAIEEGSSRAVVEIWGIILSNIEADSKGKIRPAYAMKMTSLWPFLTLAKLPAYMEHYYAILLEARAVLKELVAGKEEEIFSHTGEEDGTENAEVYKRLLVEWQKVIARFEEAWDVTHEDAGAQIAAMSEASAFLLASTGLVGHLDHIGFKLTEEESLALAAEVSAYRETL